MEGVKKKIEVATRRFTFYFKKKSSAWTMGIGELFLEFF
jgi:hypothetical protein